MNLNSMGFSPIHGAQPRGPRDPQMFSMQPSFLSQLAAQQHAHQHAAHQHAAHQQAAQQHALAQQRAAQQQMINHRNAIMMDTSRMAGVTSSHGPPSFPNTLSGIRGIPDQRSTSAAFVNRNREFIESRPISFMGHVAPVDSRPYNVPTRPSPPRPRRPSPPSFRPASHPPSTVSAYPLRAADVQRSAMPLRQTGYASTSQHTPSDRATTSYAPSRSHAATPLFGARGGASKRQGGDDGGDGSGSDDSIVLEGTRKRRRRPRARRRPIPSEPPLRAFARLILHRSMQLHSRLNFEISNSFLAQ